MMTLPRETIRPFAGAVLVAALLLAFFGWRGETADGSLFSRPTGYYAAGVTVRLRGEQVVFTLDGSLPTAASPIYTEPIVLAGRETAVHVIRARPVEKSGALGTVETTVYLVGEAPTIPVAALVVDPPDLWDAERGIYANPEARGQDWERAAVLAYFDPSSGAMRVQQVPLGVRIHGQFSRAYDKKSLRLYFRQAYGLDRWQYQLFSAQPPSPQPLPQTPNPQAHDRLILHAGGQDSPAFPSNWTLMRNQLTARLAAQTAVFYTRSQPVRLYLNGEAWGLYYLRERIGEVWLTETVGAADPLLVDTPARRAEKPNDNGRGLAYWDNLTGFIATHDMADAANFATIQTQMNIDNFIDYSILQIWSANYDWPFTNVVQFRPETQGGRWQWIIWDSDLSLGLRPWSVVEQTTIEQALDPTYAGGTGLPTDGRDTILLRALLENPAFYGRFVSRWQGLMETVLAPENVVAEIDALAAELEPHIAFETARWGSSPEAWRGQVEELRQFARARPLVMQLQLEALQAAREGR